MGEEPVGDRDEDPEETDDGNLTLKNRTWNKLEEQYPHALDRMERVRMAVHDALEERDADENDG